MFKSQKKCKMLMAFCYNVESILTIMKKRADISDIKRYKRFRNGMFIVKTKCLHNKRKSLDGNSCNFH